MTLIIDFAGLCFTHGAGLHFTHNPWYMALSYAIAAVGSYTSLEILAWLRHCAPHRAEAWRLVSGVTLGGSIWAMHFMGMLAVRISLPLSFDPKLTLASLLVAVGTAVFALWLSAAETRPGASIAVGGVVLGAGIAAMHYVGMAALQVPATIAYLPGLWIASVLIAMASAITALWVSRKPGRHQFAAALVMAAAICGMHYTGMAAAVIRINPLIVPSRGIAPGPLAVAVAATSLALLLVTLVSVAADRRLTVAAARDAEALRHANNELRRTQRELVARLCAAGEFRDHDTGAHVIRMAHVAHRLALSLGCGQAFADQLLAAAPLHDIGKIATPDAILFKPGPLSPCEQTIMRQHTTQGARMLGGSDVPLLQLAAEIAQTHHEKWDGSGYPNGLARSEIPLCSRIVAVADVLDALLSPRPYKPAWSLDQALAHIRAQSGRHFDPAVISALQRDIDAIMLEWRRFADPERRHEFPGPQPVQVCPTYTAWVEPKRPLIAAMAVNAATEPLLLPTRLTLESA